jgi:hypothetical protein
MATKKSVSKAPASKGREDSRAVQIKREKNERTSQSQGRPEEMAKRYEEREHDVDRRRKVSRSEKPKQKQKANR